MLVTILKEHSCEESEDLSAENLERKSFSYCVRCVAFQFQSGQVVSLSNLLTKYHHKLESYDFKHLENDDCAKYKKSDTEFFLSH